MKVIKRTNKELKKIIDEIKDLIQTDKYFIVPREKNSNFKVRYKLKYQDLKRILLHISFDSFVKEEFDNDTLKYGTETVLIFILNEKLINYQQEQCSINVYVKIKYTNDNLPIISIHESEE